MSSSLLRISSVGPRSVSTCQVLGVAKLPTATMRWITGMNSRWANSSVISVRVASGRSSSRSIHCSSLPSAEISDLDDALKRLEAFDARKAQILELHYFGGLTYDEMALAMGLSASTIDTELRFAKAWLRQALGTPT